MQIGGRSNCWRRSTAVIGRPESGHPQPVHGPGSCAISCWGLATCRSVVPSWPCRPPGLRSVFFRSDLGFGAALANPSEDGGLLELPEFAANRASNSAMRVRARCNSARVSISSSRSETTNAASTSSEGRDRSSGTTGHYDPDTFNPRHRPESGALTTTRTTNKDPGDLTSYARTKPPDNCDEPPQGADWGGPGYWRDVNRGDYDALWKRYEEQVTGVKRGHEYHYNDVDYDGYANEDGRHVFIEAKSRGYASQ